MFRCSLCRAYVNRLTEHGLCEECEQKFDFPAPSPEEFEEKSGQQAKRILITSLCAVGLIVFICLAVSLMMSLQ